MRYMNSFDIGESLARNSGDPILEPAAQTLANLAEWADYNSDGWAYWPKPVRAAQRLIEFLERYSGAYTCALYDVDPVQAAEYRVALRPIKAFRTRYASGNSPSFNIVERV